MNKPLKPTPTPRTPKALGRRIYVQPLNVQQELRDRRLGSIIKLVITIFGLVIGALGVYAWFLYGKDHYLLVGIGVIGLFGWILWDVLQGMTRVRIGYVCERGVGCYYFRANGEVVRSVTYPFSAATRMEERSGRTGPLTNMRDYWELAFHEGEHKRYVITHADFARDGYGHAEEDDPDKMEYLFAKEAFQRYQQAAKPSSS